MPPIGREQSSGESEAQPLRADSQPNTAATFIARSAETAANRVEESNRLNQDEVAYWLGRRLARYELTKVLGAGGMGVVYKAHDTLIERDVAIKVLPRSLVSDETILKRLLIEAKAAGRLNHPNAVGIYEIGQEGDCHYLVMELVPGGSVGDRLDKRGAFSVLEATRIVAEACQGLSAAHRVGLVHRDVKPANLLLSGDGTVKVADFGLAKTGITSGEQVTQAG